MKRNDETNKEVTNGNSLKLEPNWGIPKVNREWSGKHSEDKARIESQCKTPSELGNQKLIQGGKGQLKVIQWIMVYNNMGKIHAT